MKNTQTISRKNLVELKKIACNDWKEVILDLVLVNTNNDIEVDDKLIEKAYSEANDSQRKILNKYFKIQGDALFKITTIEEVCERLGKNVPKLSDFKQYGNNALKMLSFYQIKLLEELFNGDWKANWSNSNQYKYYPYFEYTSSSGLVFFSVVSYDYSFGGFVGYYKDSKTAEHIGRNFIEIYKNLL